MARKFGSKTWLAASNESFKAGSILLVLLHPLPVGLESANYAAEGSRKRERERKRVPRDFSILLILETGSRELIGGEGRGPKVKRRKPSRREG